MKHNKISYNELTRKCTMEEVALHPFSILYETKGNSMPEVLKKISAICEKKKLGTPQKLPYEDGFYYCGYVKKLFQQEYLYNTIFMGYSKSKKCYVAMLWWIPFVTHKYIVI